jgi:uncharacterized protein (TIGR00106 family)
MSVLVAFSVAPATAGRDASMGEAVAAAVKVVRDSGLPHETNAMFTNVEGEWDEVMDVVKRATMAVAAVSSRVSLVLKADLREGATNALRSKVESVERHLT